MEASPTVHDIKIFSTHYDRVLAGTKLFEIRNNDRYYQKGDIVILRDVDRLANITQESARPSLVFTVGDVYPIDCDKVVFSLCSFKSREILMELSKKYSTTGLIAPFGSER